LCTASVLQADNVMYFPRVYGVTALSW